MIGSEVDFETNTMVADDVKESDLVDQFGTEYGVEDGWSEEMLNAGEIKNAPLSAQGLSVQKEVDKKRHHRRHRYQDETDVTSVSHPMAGLMGFEGSMGFSLSDIQKSVQAGLNQAKSQAQAQLDAAKANLLKQAQQAASQLPGQLIQNAAAQASKAITQGAQQAATNPALLQATASLANVTGAKLEEYKEKAKPFVYAGLAAGGLYLAYRMYKKRG